MTDHEIMEGKKGEVMHRFLKEMEKAFFSGSVLVKEKEKTLLCQGYGRANATINNTPSTIFHVASLTKQFTAVAILQLVEQRKIELHNSINHYLPTRFATDDWDEITVDQLLTHTSGIPDYADWDDYWDICKELTVDKVICDVQEQGLLFQPGSNCCYSNTGYTLLGKIIEKQGAMPYRDYMTKKILYPAGMYSSGIHDKSHVPQFSDSAEGFCVEHSKLVKDQRNEFSILFADGGLYSTVCDMEKWNDVLQGKTQVLSSVSVEKMIKNGYGLRVDKAFGHKRIHHNGSMAGFRADFCKYPDDEILIVILGNNADFVVDYLTGNLAQFLLNKSFSLPELVNFPKEFDYAPYLQTYQSTERDADRTSYNFKINHLDQLILNGDPQSQCYLLSNNNIYIPNEGLELQLQNNGKIMAYRGDGENAEVLVPLSSSLFSRFLNFIKSLVN